MEILFAAIFLIGPWALAIAAIVRANRALAEAREAKEAARAAAQAEPRVPVTPPAVVAAPPPAASPPPRPAEAPAAPPPAAAPRPVADAAQRTGRPAPGPAPAYAGLEERIALVWFTRAGALALLLGAGYFLKYAIDNAWIGPWGRLAAAALSGAAALVVGEVLRPRTRAVWIHAAQGAGIALLFLAAFGSHALYDLVPAGVAFGAVAVVALLGGALAVRHRAEALLAIALAGGLLAPVILSTGEDRPAALFGYLLVLGGLALIVSERSGFRIAPWLALAGTVAIGAGWWERFFDVRPPPRWSDPSLPLAEQMGRYRPLLQRAVPMGAALAFASSWLLAWERFRRTAMREWSEGWLAASLLFAVVAPFMLVRDRPMLGAAALVAAAVLASALLHRAGRLPFVAAAEIVSLALLWKAVEERTPGQDGPWIAAAATVAVAYLAVPARAWLVRGDPPGPALAAVAAVAGLAFTGFAIALTGEREGVFRAALVGGAGAAELALGAAVVRRARAHGSVLLGASLALLAGAAAFLFSGATVTVVWAAMAGAAAVLGASERDRWWLGGAGVLFAAALLRAVTIDMASVGQASANFLWSGGAEGRLRPVFLLNPRAIALAAVAAALLVAADRVRRAGSEWRIAAGVAASVAWALAVTLAVTEARDVALSLPAPPPTGDHAAFGAFRLAVDYARVEQQGELSVVASLVMAGCASLLVAGGFIFRDAFHRWLGIGLFGAVIGKLLVSDVWQLSRLQQVSVFLGVGALLLGAAFLYARYGRRIAALLGDAPRAGGGAAAILFAAGALCAPCHAWALDPSVFRLAARIDGVSGPGLWSVEADAELLRGSGASAGTLADVRIEGPDGREVPWAPRTGGPDAPERTVEATVVDPVVLPDGSVRAVVDLGEAPPRHGELRLDLAGDDFLRAVRIEVSNDGRRFGVLAEGGRVWAIRGDPGAGRTAVRHPQSQARWLRVTLLPGAGEPPRIAGARVAAGDAPEPAVRFLSLPAPAPARSPDGRETLLDVDLGSPGLPVETLALDVATPAFERRVRLHASADRAHWVPAGGGVVWRSPGAAGGDARERLRVQAESGGRRWLRIAVEDGDSPPLRVVAVNAGWRAREILFRVEAGGPHLLLAGADVPAPAYDLAALLARDGGGRRAEPARLEAAGPNPRFAKRARAEPFTERHRTALSIGLGLLLAALAVWAVRLMRRPT